MNTIAAVYLRVSTESQTVENQRAPLVAACAARGFTPRFFEETESAAKKRPVFEAMMLAAHRGEVGAVVVAALDRLGRSLPGVLDTISKLDKAGVQTVSLREPWLDTSGPQRQLLVAIFAWVAEMERGVLIERTLAGQARARRQGKHLGRPPLATRDPESYRRLVQAAEAVRGGLTVAAAARQCRVSERSLRRQLAARAGEAVPASPGDAVPAKVSP